MYFCISEALHVLSAQVISSQDQNTDFKPFAPRLTRYQVGMGPDVAAAAVQALADLFAEMERRGKLLATLPGSPPATSRRLADKPALGLHPLICVISECHELFGMPAMGSRRRSWPSV
jgi:S-DNA-T family DNA segregation ATPase FtsK/SpoIIIE